MADLLRMEGVFENVQPFGTEGDPQEGVDITATLDDKPWGFQAKKERDFGASHVRRAISRATYPANKFVILLSRPATIGARKEIEKHPDWELWDQDDLSSRVRNLPRARAIEYIERWFSPEWAESFLGYRRATTFVDPSDYLAPLLDTTKPLHHLWSRVNSDAQWNDLQSFLAGSNQKVVIVQGPIGSGRSKLLCDLANAAGELAQHGTETLFLATGSSISMDVFTELPAEAPILLLADDIERIDGLPLLLFHLARRPNTRAVLACSTLFTERLIGQLLEANFSRDQIRVLPPLTRLNRQDTTNLIREVAPTLSADLQEIVIQHSSETPLSTILATEFYSSIRSSGPSSASNIEDLVVAHYRDVILGGIDPSLSSEDVRNVLKLLAVVGPAKVESDSWAAKASEFLAIPVDTVYAIIDALEEIGAVARRGFNYVVVPEWLRMAVSRDALIQRHRATDYGPTLLRAFGISGGLIRNLAIADIESASRGGPSVDERAWAELERLALEGSNVDRIEILEALEEVAAIKPDQTLRLVRTIYDVPDAPPSSDTNNLFHLDRDYVISHIPPIAKILLANDPRVAPEVVALLWEMGRDDKRQLSSHTDHPLRVIRDLTEPEFRRMPALAEQIVNAVADLLAETGVDEHYHSPVEIISPILGLDAMRAVSRGSQLQVEMSIVPIEASRTLRNRLIDIFSSMAAGESDRLADEAIKALAQLLRNPTYGVLSQSEQQEYDRERSRALDVFDEIIAQGRFPIRELRIRKEIHWHARRASSTLVRDRSRSIVQRPLAPTTALLRTLVPELRDAESLVPIDREDIDYALLTQLEDDFFVQVSKDAMNKYPSPNLFIEDLLPLVDLAHRARLQPDLASLFGIIMRLNPDYGRGLFTQALRVEGRDFDMSIGGMLMVAWRVDPQTGGDLYDVANAIARPSVRLALAKGLSFRQVMNGTDSLDAGLRRSRILALMDDEDPEVRRQAAFAAHLFLTEYPDSAVGFLREAVLGTDGAVAENLFAAFAGRDDQIDIEEDTIRGLVEKLQVVDELEHFSCHFLRRVAHSSPELVLSLLAYRIEHAETLTEAIPYPGFSQIGEALGRSANAAALVSSFIDRTQALSDPKMQMARGRILRAIFNEAPSLAREIILSDANSSDAVIVDRGFGLVKYLDWGPLVGDQDLVRALLSIAESLPRARGDLARDTLRGALLTGASTSSAYGPSDHDAALREFASRGVASSRPASKANEFFNQLLRTTERAIDAQRRISEEAFGPE